MARLDFVLAMTTFDSVKDYTVTSILKLLKDKRFKFEPYFRARESGIGRDKSILATRFMEHNESDILIFIDSDVVFTPEQIIKLLEAQKKGFNIVAGGYLMKNGALALRVWEHLNYDKMIEGGIYEVEYASAGFMSISREVFLKIKKEMNLPLLHSTEPTFRNYPFFETGRDWSGRHDFFLSEDWDFCEKAMKVGYKIYFHTGVLVTHLKETAFVPTPTFVKPIQAVTKGGRARV